MPQSKTLPPAKLKLVLGFVRRAGVACTLKDLEKELPPKAGISSMVVKDYLNALEDDHQINMEKIGSCNWYWSFPAEARRQKEAARAQALKARDEVRATVAAAEKAAAEESEARLLASDDATDPAELAKVVEDLRRERDDLQRKHGTLTAARRAKTGRSDIETLLLKHNQATGEPWPPRIKEG